MPWVGGASQVVLGILGYLVSWDQGALGGWYISGCPDISHGGLWLKEHPKLFWDMLWQYWTNLHEA